MSEFIVLFFQKSWEFFQIPWPGFSFSIGDVFLAAMFASGCLLALSKMSGVSITGTVRGFSSKGGNNSRVQISDDRKGDSK